MAWETATIIGFFGAAFLFLYIALNRRDETEKVLPLQLLFVTVALGMVVLGLNSNTLIINANNESIDAGIVGNLTGLTSRAATVSTYSFWIFVLVTVISLVLAAVAFLVNKGKELGSKSR